MGWRTWLHNYIENEGLAKLTLTLLAVTCLVCLSYTWGYYEVRAQAMVACICARGTGLIGKSNKRSTRGA